MAEMYEVLFFSLKDRTSSSLFSCCLVWERTMDSARFRSISCETLYGSYIEKRKQVTITTLQWLKAGESLFKQ